LSRNHRNPLSLLRVSCVSIFFLLIAGIGVRPASAETTDPFCAVYLPAHKITERTFDEIVHYAGLTPINAVVLHVKTPRGSLAWPSKNALATELGVSSATDHLRRHIHRLHDDHIHVIAKLDLFADHRLATVKPELGIADKSTGKPWFDANGLAWSNPTDCRVWDYNIALASELARMGVDEIQFDYVRFPSDGNLAAIHYPNAADGFSKSDVIAGFLKRAHNTLKPFGIIVSADVFGLTAWKTDDFGVGQVLEKMDPYLDVICPMFYPSHFPAGFLGKQSPGDFPEMIMAASVRSMLRRTAKPIRPWVQGFWYKPQQIVDQLNGIDSTACGSWSIWSPTGRYGVSYEALSQCAGISFPRPRFYPTLATLRSHGERRTRGHGTVVNYTDYVAGYSILALEASTKRIISRYSTLSSVLRTLDEGIIDHVLAHRTAEFSVNAEPSWKRKRLVDLLCADIGKDPRRMRPGKPIYIDWSGDCYFTTQAIPALRLDLYARVGRQPSEKNAAAIGSTAHFDMAAVAEGLADESINCTAAPVILAR
jgi:hypothetical protein